MKQSILKDKSKLFALRIINLYKYLCNTQNEYVLSKQLLRSGTSIGANIAEGSYAQSNTDFIHKLSISQKECAETIYWIELLHESNYLSTEQFESINTDVVELMKILTTSLKTAKQKLITNH